MATRISVAGARTDRLFFAQVREDPNIELTALAPGPDDRVVVVSSGGCTALSLLAAGAARVDAVDLNRTQNHMVELKVAALRTLSRAAVLAFIGAIPAPASARHRWYAIARAELTPAARAYWDDHGDDVGKGILACGVGERFIALVTWALRYLVQSPVRLERLLACRTLAEQRELFAREWDHWRWRALYALLVNRWTLSRAYDSGFFTHVGRKDFAAHLRRLAEHVLTDVPVANNYFLHQMLSGRYPVDQPDGVPPYLSEGGSARVAEHSDRLTLVDGSVLEYLRLQKPRSVDCIALSNICEWLTIDEIGDLFNEVERVAAPGARVVFRNYVGHTELPAGCTRLVADHALGDALLERGRSAVESRVVVCRTAA
jgi:S-adenosylmethionine-diacylglycerol 3-amino-3-carboxypropyl transferase